MVIDVVKILVFGFVLVPLIMFVGVHLLLFWIAGMMWFAKKFDDFMCWLIWGE